MIYLIAGLDRRTFARWHDHVMAADPTLASRIARARAATEGVELVVAAVVGPYSNLETEAVDPMPVARTGYLRPEAA